MAKFCSNCGRPLTEGQECVCEVLAQLSEKEPTTDDAHEEIKTKFFKHENNQPTADNHEGQVTFAEKQPMTENAPVQNQQNYGQPPFTQQVPPQGQPNVTQENVPLQGQPNYSQPNYGQQYGGLPNYGQPYHGYPQQMPPTYGQSPQWNGLPYYEPPKPSATKIFFQQMGRVFKGLFTTPAKTIELYVDGKHYGLGWFFIGFSALVLSLIVLMFANNIFTLVNQTFGSFGGFMGDFPFMRRVKVPYEKFFFYPMIGSAVANVLFALIILFFTKVVYRGALNFSNAINAVAIGSVPFALSVAVTGIVLLVLPQVAFIFFTFGMILSFFYTYYAVKYASKLNANAMLLNISICLTLSYLINILISYIVIRNIFPIINI